jgi:CRISPR-associated endonuclease/helicase Cas3
MEYYAHTSADRPWEPLEKHLGDVAVLAARFAAEIGAAEWGRLAGMWHDLGKYQPEFQQYLHNVTNADAHQSEMTGRVDHSTPVAQHAFKNVKVGGRLLAYIIAGHHSGLLDATCEEDGTGASLQKRLEKFFTAFDIPQHIADQPTPAPPELNRAKDVDELAFRVAFFCRMLFSCLVDADFLATEHFMNPRRAAARPPQLSGMDSLRVQLDGYLNNKYAAVEKSTVNVARRSVLDSCRRAAELPQGFFSLTVPTGGGKTLSSLAFALHHACHSGHQLQRVICAIPYTSIIEQNAGIYRRVLGPFSEWVLEHHGNIDPERTTERERLATENWDAPVVVTTNVQLFESLFANGTSRCRKLHRIAHSVIVLDEAQTLPTELIKPTLAALRELVANYGCTVVLCTATQLAITLRRDFGIGLERVEEIMGTPAEVNQLFNTLRRTRIEHAGLLEDETLAQRLANEPQVLCIVNSRAHAASLFCKLAAIKPNECFHLSTRLCARHRSVVLWLIRRRLRAGRPCRIVSTSLIEAGVDIDLPIVYRAMTGLDSIAQAAGRCNREGHQEIGRVITFETAWKSMPEIRQAAGYTREVLPDHADPLSPAAIAHYFRLRLWKRKNEWDKHGICTLYQLAKSGEQFQFNTVAKKYKLIIDNQISVFVPYGRRGRRLVNSLLEMTNPAPWERRSLERKLQRYTVGVYKDEELQMEAAGYIVPHQDNKYHVAMDSSIAGAFKLYDSQLGLLSPKEINVDLDVWIS